jgi:hypothetical protein
VRVSVTEKKRECKAALATLAAQQEGGGFFSLNERGAKPYTSYTWRHWQHGKKRMSFSVE